MAKTERQPKKFLTFNRNKSKDFSYDDSMARTNSTPSQTHAIAAPPVQPVINQLELDSLRQGQLYLIRGRLLKLALFEGWNDDTCLVFSVLRDELTPFAWSEVKYLAGDFDVFEAFDTDGNPPIWVWKRALGSELPHHWFRMFEEARRRQADWTAVYGEDMAENELSNHPPGANNIEASSAHHYDDTAAPIPDRDDLRTFIKGSATEPNGSGFVDNKPASSGKSVDGGKSTKNGKKSNRKALAGLFG